MPRVSREQTEQNRAAIEEASSRLFRERGLQHVSLADLMGEAGLTHGGFYGHFESKDALAASVCASAFEQSIQRWQERADRLPDAATAFTAIVDSYLSKKARDMPGTSCPATALAIDVAREPEGALVHDAFLQGLEGLVGVLTELHNSGDAAADRRRALVEMSTLVGAQALARATRGNAISNELLEASRSHLAATHHPSERAGTQQN